MQFVNGTGIITYKSELKALLACCWKAGDSDFGIVTITVDDRKLVAKATDGVSCSLFHHGPVEVADMEFSSHAWQIQQFAVAALERLSGASDEIVVSVDKKGHLGRVTIRNIESGESRVPDINVGACATEQLSLAGMTETPLVIERGTHVGHVILSPANMKRIPVVAKAAGTDMFALYPPETPDGDVLCVFDTAERVLNGTCSSWVMAIKQEGTQESEA